MSWDKMDFGRQRMRLACGCSSENTGAIDWAHGDHQECAEHGDTVIAVVEPVVRYRDGYEMPLHTYPGDPQWSEEA